MEMNQECYIGHNGHYFAPGILRSVHICFIPVVLHRCPRLGINSNFVHPEQFGTISLHAQMVSIVICD